MNAGLNQMKGNHTNMSLMRSFDVDQSTKPPQSQPKTVSLNQSRNSPQFQQQKGAVYSSGSGLDG